MEQVGWFSFVMAGELADVSEIVVLKNVDLHFLLKVNLALGFVMLLFPWELEKLLYL